MAKAKKVTNTKITTKTKAKPETKSTKKPVVKKPVVKNKKPVVKKPVVKKPAAKKTTRTRKTATLAKETNPVGVCRALCFSNCNSEIQDILLHILEIKSQTYTENIDYIVNIGVNSKKEETNYKDIIGKYIDDCSLKIVFSYNQHSDMNNDLRILEHINKQKYNTFIYCDNLFRYHKNHIENTINLYNDKSCDVLQIACANKIDTEINIHKSKEKKYNFVLNNKALDVLLNSESKNHTSWTTDWSQHKIKLRQIGNINTLYLIDKPKVNLHQTLEIHNTHADEYYKVLEGEHFTICIFEHNYWSSYVYLNKRNNRMYNIMNDDHGAFDIVDDHKIKITWDTWGDEIFYKKCNGDQYHYSINE